MYLPGSNGTVAPCAHSEYAAALAWSRGRYCWTGSAVQIVALPTPQPLAEFQRLLI